MIIAWNKVVQRPCCSAFDANDRKLKQNRASLAKLIALRFMLALTTEHLTVSSGRQRFPIAKFTNRTTVKIVVKMMWWRHNSVNIMTRLADAQTVRFIDAIMSLDFLLAINKKYLRERWAREAISSKQFVSFTRSEDALHLTTQTSSKLPRFDLSRKLKH